MKCVIMYRTAEVTMLLLEKIDQREALRYMGYKSDMPDEKIQGIIDRCEKDLLAVVKPKFIYKVFDISHGENAVNVEGTTLVLEGKDISAHLKDCTKCVLLAATLSSGADMIIRRLEAEDMTKAVITDFLASAAVEQVCDMVDKTVKSDLPQLEQTWRFSPGYGDLPIEIQGEFLQVLDAPKRIGLNATANNILTPRKSVTAVIGLSENKISKGRRGCVICSMKDTCPYRKRGEHCGS